MPTVGTAQELKSQALIRSASDELDDVIQKALEPLTSPTFELNVYFGKGGAKRYDALASALTAGSIAAAGLDVYAHEPQVAPALLACPNAVLLPHLGSATLETRTAMGMRVLKNVDAFFAGLEKPLVDFLFLLPGE